MFSLLGRLPLSRFALAHAITLAPTLGKSLASNAASADAFLGIDARIAHLSVSFERI
jgi:hypothetical protein